MLSQAEAQLELDLSHGTCALEAETVVKLLTLKQIEEAGENTTVLSDTMANLVPGYSGGEWSLFFANCQKPSVVSFDLSVSLYNIHNGQKDYLSIGEDMIPSVYLVRHAHVEPAHLHCARITKQGFKGQILPGRVLTMKPCMHAVATPVSCAVQRYYRALL